MTVYIDAVFVLNLAVNYLLLRAAATLGGASLQRGRLLLGALIGLQVAGLPLSVYAQLGIVLLVGLSSKNAILVVEFAKERRARDGLAIVEAALSAARERFRAVLMTALTFVLGIAPLVWATGAGAGSRRAIGTATFAGMLAATLVGLVFVPGLYVLFQTLREKVRPRETA